MKAAVLHGPRDIRLEEVDRPSIGPDEVLLKVRACGICGTDLHRYRSGESVNRILGHEYAGEVAEVGPDVDGLRAGDEVLGVGYRLRGWEVDVPGEGLDGAFAEYVAVPNPAVGDSFLHKPPDMSWELAATVEPLSIACFVFEQTSLQPEDTAVILGAGMIGLCLLQVCTDAGISRVEPFLLQAVFIAAFCFKSFSVLAPTDRIGRPYQPPTSATGQPTRPVQGSSPTGPVPGLPGGQGGAEAGISE